MFTFTLFLLTVFLPPNDPPSAQGGSNSPPPRPPLINEFVFNHTGSDINEFVEILGDAKADYAGFTLLEIEGDAGTSAGVIDEVLPVGSTDANGYWTTGFLSNKFENGTVTLLLVEGFTGKNGLDLDLNNDGVLDASPPWVRIVDAVGVSDGDTGDLVYASTVLAPHFDGDKTTPGGASRMPDGQDTETVSDWLRNDEAGFGLPAFPDAPETPSGKAVNTPGTSNQPGYTPPPPPPPENLLINEIDTDTPGTDTREFIELFDGGKGNTPLDHTVLVFFNGSTDASYLAIDLDHQATDERGFFLIGGEEVVPRPHLILPQSALQNGPDAVALYAGTASDFPNGTPLSTRYLIDAIVYDTQDDDDFQLLTLLHPGQPQVDESATRDPESVSLQRLPHGSGGARNTESYSLFPPTPGAINGGADLSLVGYLEPLIRPDPSGGVALLVSLRCGGPAPASDIAIRLVWPEEVEVVQAEALTGQLDLATSLWHVSTLHPGDTAALRVWLRTTDETMQHVFAEVVAAQQPDPDSVPGDGRGDDATSVLINRPPPRFSKYQADLSLALTGESRSVALGDTLFFSLSIKNDGPYPSAGVMVAISLPEGLSLVNAKDEPTFDPARRLWDIDKVRVLESQVLSFGVIASQAGDHRIQAEITASNLPDPDSMTRNQKSGEDDWGEWRFSSFSTTPQVVSILSETPRNQEVWFHPPFPNPLTHHTTLVYDLPQLDFIILEVIDLLGRTVAVIFKGSVSGGRHTTRWEAASALPDGIYFIRLTAGSKVWVRPVTLRR